MLQVPHARLQPGQPVGCLLALRGACSQQQPTAALACATNAQPPQQKCKKTVDATISLAASKQRPAATRHTPATPGAHPLTP